MEDGILDFDNLNKPDDYPLFDKEYPSPIKGLVIQAEDPSWLMVRVSVYLEDDTWNLEASALMNALEVLKICDEREWLIITSGFMKKIQNLDD